MITGPGLEGKSQSTAARPGQPATQRALTGTAAVRAARLVGRVPIMRLSARNQLDGEVVRVDHGAVMSTVLVRLTGGQEVVSAITRDSAESLGLAKGDVVKVVFKATEVMIGKD
jgi:molybdopterin-binding protein